MIPRCFDLAANNILTSSKFHTKEMSGIIPGKLFIALGA